MKCCKSHSQFCLVMWHMLINATVDLWFLVGCLMFSRDVVMFSISDDQHA